MRGIAHSTPPTSKTGDEAASIDIGYRLLTRSGPQAFRLVV